MPSFPPGDNQARPSSNSASDADDLISRLLADTSEIFEQPIPASPAPIPAQSTQLSVDDLLNFRSNSSTSPNPPYVPAGQIIPSYQPFNLNAAIPPYIPPGQAAPPAYYESPPPPYRAYNPYPTGSVRPAKPAYNPDFGYDRGFFYYKDEFGETVLMEKAGFGARLSGAVVDWIVSGILVTIFANTLGSFIASSLVENKTIYNEISYNSSQPVVLNTMTDLFVTVALVTGLLAAVVSALYYILMIGLNGQTLGHRAANIRVIRGGGRPADFVAAAIRTLYGALPEICTFGLLPVITQEILFSLTPSRNSAETGNLGLLVLMVAVISLLILFGFLWLLFDQKGQGWHDKLADTYVVKTQT